MTLLLFNAHWAYHSPSLVIPFIHWASKETYHFFSTTLTKIHCLKINNIWRQISFNTPWKEYLKNTIFSRGQKGENAVKSRKVIFRKSQKLLTERAPQRQPIQKFNSYSFSFNGGLRKHRTGFCLLRTPSPRGKQFLWFLKIISSMIKGNFFFRCAC